MDVMLEARPEAKLKATLQARRCDRSSPALDGPPTVIDLFGGVGGLSLGAARAGFHMAVAVDNDARAQQAHKTNFPTCQHVDCDITELSASTLLETTGLERGRVCGIVGGPPCQGFSRIGRRSLEDDRNSLFGHFFRIVSEARPHFFLAENVPGILDRQYDAIRLSALGKPTGYCQLDPFTLRASDFGAATSRDRVFFVGWLPEYFEVMAESDFFAIGDSPQTTVETALRGLRRKINAEWQAEEQGWRKLTCLPEGWYWEKTFRDIPDGVGDPIAVSRLDSENLVSGCLGTRHNEGVVGRFEALAEGEIDGPSRAKRLVRKGFCPTLRSGTGPEHGSYQALRPIHPTEPRVVTPREAARLQGFPDWFLFDATKWHGFRQIGNSVSPILAEHVLSVIHSKRR